MVQLPNTERMIFLMHDVERYDHTRIASLLGISLQSSIEGPASGAVAHARAADQVTDFCRIVIPSLARLSPSKEGHFFGIEIVVFDATVSGDWQAHAERTHHSFVNTGADSTCTNAEVKVDPLAASEKQVAFRSEAADNSQAAARRNSSRIPSEVS